MRCRARRRRAWVWVLPRGPAAVVVAAGGGGVQDGERGEEHGAFELPVPASWWVFAVDRGARLLRGQCKAGVGGQGGRRWGSWCCRRR
jgi:hypothetical protein